MNNKNWFIAIGVAAMVAVSGMAIVSAADQEAPKDRPQIACDIQQGMRAGRPDHTKLLKLLKIDEATFRAELKDGKTLAAIAKEHGVSEQQLKEFMVKEMTERIDAGVKAGRLTQDQAEQMKAKLNERVTAMINGKGPMPGYGPMHGPGRMLEDSKLPELLQMDANTLRSELKAGKTLVAIAGEHGVSEQQLKDFIIKNITQRIDEGVSVGRISADRAAQMKAGLEQVVTDMINGKHPMHGLGPCPAGQRPDAPPQDNNA